MTAHAPRWRACDPQLSLPAERQAHGAAPEIEALEPEVLVEEIVVFQRIIIVALLEPAEVAQVAADADVVGELAVEAAADVEAEVIRRQIVEESLAAADVRAHQPEARRKIRTHGRAQWRAEQQVGHQRRHIAVAEVEVAIAGRVFEEVRRPAKVDLETHHIGYPADRHAEVHTTLDLVVSIREIAEVGVAAKVRADER